MEVEASILVDAPRDDVFAILTEDGGPARLRINPRLKAQRVVEHDGAVYVCENEWEKDGRRIVQRRRYTLFPPDRIEEEVVGARDGLLRVTTRVDAEGDQTRLTMRSEYRFGGVLGLLAGFAAEKLREEDDRLLEVLKAGLEAEFEEVADDP